MEHDIFHGNSMTYSTWNSMKSPWSFQVFADVEFDGKSSMQFPWNIFYKIPWNFHGRFSMESFSWNSLKYKTGTTILQDRRKVCWQLIPRKKRRLSRRSAMLATAAWAVRTSRDRRDHEQVNESGSVALTEQRHRLGVAGERADVLLDPVKRGDDVE